MSRDPIGEVGGINLYNYVGGNPVNYIDPTGNFSLLGVIGAVATGYGLYKLVQSYNNANNSSDMAKAATNSRLDALNDLANNQNPTQNPDAADQRYNDATRKLTQDASEFGRDAERSIWDLSKKIPKSCNSN